MPKTVNEHVITMSNSLKSGNFDEFIQIERDYYDSFIKTTEDPQHYFDCYRRIESLVGKYGDFLFNASHASGFNHSPQMHDDKVCFFLPSLDNDFAHIEFLYDLLFEHSPHAKRKFFVAGFSKHPDRIVSGYLADLVARRHISIWPVHFSHAGVLGFIRNLLKSRVGLLVVYSVPTLLGALGRGFNINRTIWIPTKFPIPIFPEIQRRLCSTPPVHGSTKKDRNVIWNQLPVSAFPSHRVPKFIAGGRSRAKLISINREEKIANPEFLLTVTRILKENSSVVFYWTGREENKSVTDYFFKAGVITQTRFIGWVDVSRTIGEFDIFLDTNLLSGTVAARAFSSGMPTVLSRGAHTWVEVHEKRISEVFGESVLRATLCDSNIDYAAEVTRLIRSETYYLARADLQRQIASECFFDTRRMYEEYMRVIGEMIEN